MVNTRRMPRKTKTKAKTNVEFDPDKKETILVVVESPSKIKKMESILSKLYPNKKFIAKASYGHIMDIDKAGDAIDIENNFTPNYVSYSHSRCKSTISTLKTSYKK